MSTDTRTTTCGSAVWDIMAHEDLEAIDQARVDQWAREHPDPLRVMQARVEVVEAAIETARAEIERLAGEYRVRADAAGPQVGFVYDSVAADLGGIHHGLVLEEQR